MRRRWDHPGQPFTFLNQRADNWGDSLTLPASIHTKKEVQVVTSDETSAG